MDKNNLPNNNQTPEQSQGYTNFNQYPTQPADASQQMPANPYQAMPQQAENNKGKVLGIISIVLSVLGCCCAYLASVPAAILGLIGVIRNKKSVVSWIGLVLFNR